MSEKDLAETDGVQEQVQKTEGLPEQLKTEEKSGEEYSAGLECYRKQDYENAFKYLFHVAENRDPENQEEAQERTEASYLVAMMYRNGMGVNPDTDRSNHYLKRAADFGYDQAQYMYGRFILTQHRSAEDADLKVRKEGWRYIEKAADAGLVDAIKMYISLAGISADADRHIIAKAKAYIPLMKGHFDSYEEQKCADWEKALVAAGKKAGKKSFCSGMVITGEILFLIGTIYLFKGLNPIFFEKTIPQVSRFILTVPDSLILKWDRLLAVTEPYMTHQAIFGGWLIILGNFIKGPGLEKTYKCKGTKIFVRVVNLMILALCAAHFAANVIETAGFFGNGSYMQFLVMIGCILVGRLLGWILCKIMK